MNHVTIKKAAWVLLFIWALNLWPSFTVPVVKAAHPLQPDQPVWALEKAWSKEDGAFKDIDVVYSISNGNVTASRTFVEKDGAHVTWEGTNSWGTPPVQLVPGQTYETNLAATALVTTDFGAANIKHDTTLWVGSEEVGFARAWSFSNQGAASDSKTVTWKAPSGYTIGERLVITIGASGTQGTLNYLYQYVWVEEGGEIPTRESEPQTTPTRTQPAQRQPTQQETAVNDSGARFSDLYGQVEWRPHDDEEGWRVAKFGDIIPVDAHIKTMEKSGAIISFADMSTFTLKPESEIVISSPAAKDSQIQLLWGNLMVNIRKMAKDGSMEIEMSQAVSGIKGTRFILSETGSKSIIQVLEGVVDFHSKNSSESVQVTRGEAVEATEAGLSEIMDFDPAAEEAKWQAEVAAIGNHVPDLVTKSPINLPGGALALVVCGSVGLLVLGLGGLGVLVLVRRRSSSIASSGVGQPKGGMGWLGWTAGAVAVLGLCCLLAGTAALFFPSARQFLGVNGLELPGNGWNPEPTETAERLALVPSPENTPIIWPEVTAAASETTTLEPVVPTVEPTPVEPTATEAIPSQTSVPTRVAQVFQDDFSDLSTGWLQLDDDVRMVGYHEGAMYGIALLQPGSDANILIPHGFDLPLSEVSLYFRARPVEGKGYFGVMCNYVDSQNYLLIGITEGGYMVASKESGQFSSFFDSLWIQDPYVASEDGEFQVLAVCGSDIIQLMVNEYSIPEVSNPGIAGGDVSIMAHADQDAVIEWEFFYKVLFDDLELNAK